MASHAKIVINEELVNSDPGLRGAEWIVSFRIGGDNLDPDAVTAAIGVPPSSAHKKGSPRVAHHPEGTEIAMSPWPWGLWRLESPIPPSADLVDHLKWIVQCVGPRMEQLREFREQGLVLDIICGGFLLSPTATAGFTLPATLLRSLTDLGVELIVDMHAKEA